MQTIVPYLRLILCMAWFIPWSVSADQIILNTGEHFTSDKIWEENDKIRFNMHGLVVSVDKADVVAVVRSDGSPQPLTAPQPKRQPDIGKMISPAPSATKKPVKQADPPIAPKAKKPAPAEPAQAAPKVRGIGFDGIEWQMRPSQIPGIEKYKTDPEFGGIDQYWRPEGSLKLGNVLLDGLVFGFWQNRLYTITIWVEGRPSYDKLQQVVMDRYGEGQKNPQGLERYIWLEPSTDRMLEFDEASNSGILWMRSRELDGYVKRRYPE